jgi:hypothetical protein
MRRISSSHEKGRFWYILCTSSLSSENSIGSLVRSVLSLFYSPLVIINQCAPYKGFLLVHFFPLSRTILLFLYPLSLGHMVTLLIIQLYD